ncbi:hypothetical protein A3L11_08270 [Thermococcus siculi]|uniref:ATPase AAA-type core domain-containing protein n=2 Tax=Thermococcus siculi TaxID=72803 RepID=A0A2Z2MPA5_9EURY|nr:hypothetical protein A3L11_08270 [Thermococcus siculi]
MPNKKRAYVDIIKEISEFRGTKKISRELPLKKFNVLIGKNNSGKSTLLEALLLTVGYMFNKGVIRDYSKKLFSEDNRRPLPIEPITGDSILKFLENRHRNLQSLVYGYTGVSKITVSLKMLDTLSIHLFHDGRVQVRLSTPRSQEIMDNVSSQVDVVYFPYDTSFIRTIDRFLETSEVNIVKRKIHTKTAKLVSENIDENFTEIVLKKDGWYLRRDDASYIHIDDVGDGLKKAIRTIMTVELLNPSLILWDDFDTSLHPSMIKMLLKWLAQGEWQVVLATHSIDVLYYLADLNEELDEFDAQLILLKKDQTDTLYHKELNMDELEDILEANLDPRMLVSELKI